MLCLNEEKKILEILKENNLTNYEIAIKTKLNLNNVRKLTSILKKEGKILTANKKGRSFVYTINKEYKKTIKAEKPSKNEN